MRAPARTLNKRGPTSTEADCSSGNAGRSDSLHVERAAVERDGVRRRQLQYIDVWVTWCVVVSTRCACVASNFNQQQRSGDDTYGGSLRSRHQGIERAVEANGTSRSDRDGSARVDAEAIGVRSLDLAKLRAVGGSPRGCASWSTDEERVRAGEYVSHQVNKTLARYRCHGAYRQSPQGYWSCQS